MKAVRLHEYGQRPVVEDVPEPSVAGATDVIVRIGGAGLCRTDLHIIDGQWADRMAPRLPYTLGHENAGWVEAVGDGVIQVRPGDAVIVHPLVTCGVCAACRGGNDMHCPNGAFPGVSIDGGMAEFLHASARSVLKLPAGIEPRDVAAHADAGLTAYHAVKKLVRELGPGTVAVVIGGGGLGHIAVQVLRALTSAHIVIVDRLENAASLGKEVGAHEAVIAKGSQVQEIRAMTDGLGADVVFDFVGENGTEADGLAMTRNGGTYSVIGYGGRIDVPTMELIVREVSIVGNLVGTFTDLAELMTLQAEGQVQLHTRFYPLEAVNDAIGDLDAGRLQGRGVLIP